MNYLVPESFFPPSPNRRGMNNPSKRSSKLMALIQKSVIITGKDALAEEFDVSITTIERWIREGIPRESGDDLAPWRFHRGKVSKWRREHHSHD